MRNGKRCMTKLFGDGRRAVDALARAEGRSRSKMISRLVKEALDAREKRRG